MQQTGTIGVKNKKRLCGKGDPQGIMQEIKIDHTTKCYLLKPEFVLENETHKILWDFEIQTDRLIRAKRPELVLKNKLSSHVPAGHRGLVWFLCLVAYQSL